MPLDEAVFRALYSVAHRSVALDSTIVFLGKYLIWLLIAGVLIKVLYKKDWGEHLSAGKSRFQVIALATLAVILSRGMIANLIYSLFENPRPFVALDIEPLFNHLAVSSLPSGHMSLLVPVALTGFLLNRRTGWWTVLLTLCVGVARVIAGVHWPSDILAGILTGTISFAVAYLVFRKKGLLPS